VTTVVLTQCAACNSPLREQINSRMASGGSDKGLSAWLKEMGPEFYISRMALGRHRHAHLRTEVEQARAEAATVLRKQQRTLKTPLTDLALLVRDAVADDLSKTDGTLKPTVAEGLRAQEILDRRAERSADRDLMLQIAQVMSGAAFPVIEGEYREEPELIAATSS